MNKKIMLGCGIGNIVEWYDFMIYGGLLPYLTKLFFPNAHNYISVILGLAIFASGFLMRPVGSIFFGHIGDRYGRKPLMIR
ncbi:MAG: MFS transporter [Pseudomonadota bacterium]